MKLRKDDQVMIIVGKDKGKTGKVLSVIPTENKVLVENLNVVKRHTKPSTKVPRGGIIEIAKPINASKVMAIDPETKLPARIGYTFAKDGSKERTFKVSQNLLNAKKTKPAKAEKVEKTDAEAKPVAKKAPAKKAEEKK